MDREEKLKILEELGGMPEEEFDKLYSNSVRDIKDQYTILQAAYKNGDMEEVKARAHAIKGAAANYRIKGVHEASKALEKAAGGNKEKTLIGDCFNELAKRIEEM